MPELPEVETIVRELRLDCSGKTINRIVAYNGFDNCAVSSGCDFADLEGRKILDIQRRGKFIVLVLENNLRLVIHLRMTGRVMWETPNGREKYLRASISFTDGSVLYFSDVRKFGKLWVCSVDDVPQVTGIGKLGPEPFELSLERFRALFINRKGGLKNVLLRQDIVAGIGNIYADEICFRSGIHPSGRLEKLKTAEINRVYESLIYCLEEGIKHCGVSVSDFVGTKGDLGKHQNYLKVYGRVGDKCYSCKNIIQKTRVAGRGTYYCGECQKLK